MAYLLNDAANFADEYVAGLVAAHPTRIRAVSGGVARVGAPEAGTVAVVIGGGSGHYPAFGGLVGQGLAHGAALGNLFASPSAQQVAAVASAVDTGAGVLFCFGNYAGDVLNFRLAADRLADDGIETRTVAVTDDIASAASDDLGRRRGIAGGLVVYKCAAASAEAGGSLNTVAAVAARANDRVRTLGIAFSGCTLPGATEPLFTVPAGRMAVGMGIHGEPGISETDIPSADGVADLLVDTLIAELPEGIDSPRGQRVVVLLNGLGSVKYEELFVVYRRVRERLEAAGAVVADSEVGEMVTSFEMAGLSLSLFWVDAELEALWNAPVDSAAFRRGAVAQAGPAAVAAAGVTAAATALGSEDSQRAAAVVLTALESIRTMTVERRDELGALDAIAGDGDHGIGMERGATAAARAAGEAQSARAGAGAVLAAAGDAWSDRAGGTSGLLWGLALVALGRALGDEESPTLEAVARGVRDAATRISEFGNARLGDKTMLDAMLPFADSLDASVGSESLYEAWSRAAAVATESAAATADIVASIGRARPHAEKSLGTPDPGATSFAYAVSAVLPALAGN